MNVRFLSPAAEEYSSAIKYYEQQSSGLGKEFVKFFDDAIELIKQFPNAWQKMNEIQRRCMLKRFPYGIIYTVEKNQILVLSVMNLNREPGLVREYEA